MYCKEGQTLENVNFTQHLHEYFCISSPNSKAESFFSHNFFNVSKPPHNSIYIKEKQASLQLSLMWEKKTQQNSVPILDIILHVSEEKSLPRIGSLIYLEIIKVFLTKEHYIVHTALKECQGHVD